MAESPFSIELARRDAESPFSRELARRASEPPAPAENPFAAEMARRQALKAQSTTAPAENVVENPFAVEIARRQALRAQPQTSPAESTMSDVVTSFASGAARGANELMLLPSTLGQVVARQTGKIAGAAEDLGRRALGLEPASPERVAGRNSIADAWSDSLDRARNWRESNLHEPKTTAGGYANAIGEAAPGALLMPAAGIGARALNVARYAAVPGVASEAAGNHPWVKGTRLEGNARMAAGLAASLAAPAITNAPSRVISPLTIPPERQALVDILDREGVRMTAGQRTGNPILKGLENVISEVPLAGGGAERVLQGQRSDFASAVLGRAGGRVGEGELATPDVMNRTAQDLGDRFGDLSRRNIMANDAQLRQDTAAVLQAYNRAHLPTNQSPNIQATVDDLNREPWGIPGRRYQNLRSSLSRDARSLRVSDPPTAQASRDLRDALDQAMTRTLNSAGRPEDAADWANARRQYANYKIIEDAKAGAGELSAQGAISPPHLAAAVKRSSKADYVRGRGDLADLARAGAGVLPPIPNSGTAPRAQAFRILGAAGGGAGAAGLAASGHVPEAMALVATPALMGRAVMSPAMQAYLANQLGARLRVDAPAAERKLGLADWLASSSTNRGRPSGSSEDRAR